MRHKRTPIHVVWSKSEKRWLVKVNGKILAGFPRKVMAVGHARLSAVAEQPSSLRIHGKNGRIQEERTYPRGSDPYPPRG